MKKEIEANAKILSFYDEEDIQEIQDLKKINLVLKKNVIFDEDNDLINSAEKSSLIIINHINELSKKDLYIQKDLIELFEYNFTFIKILNSYLKRKLNNLTNNDSTYFFKDISNMMKIFSISTPFKIFNSYNDYNFKDLSSLLRDIENNLIKLKEEKEALFEVKFDSYVILLEALTQLCFINSTDSERKKTIGTFLNLMQESMNILKFNTPLSEDKLEILNHIQGTHLYYFFEKNKIDLEDKNIEKILKNLYHQMEKLQDGYTLSKNCNFGREKNHKHENEEFYIFKNNSSLILLDLINKLEISNISFERYKELDIFKKILKLYGDSFQYALDDNYELNSLETFKKSLLDSLVYEYKINEDFTKIINHNTILSDFIFTDKDFLNTNIKTIYLVLKYSKDIENFKYLHIGQILAKSKKINNDYYEYYKLKIFILIINHFTKQKAAYEVNELLILIKKYIDENKTASHLFELYSQVYLSLALYYSKDSLSIKEANENYFLYNYTNPKSILEYKHFKINEEYLINIGKYYINELKLNQNSYEKDSLIEFSQNMLKKYVQNEELELKLQINEYLSNLSNEILNNPLWEFKDIDKKLNLIIQNYLFGGVCKVFILGKKNEQEEPEDIGYNYYNLELDDSYALRFIYPIINEEKFNSILNNNRNFLMININNILKTLKQNDKQMIDYISGLYNIDKLKESIKNSNEDKIGLIEIYIKSFDKINTIYGFEKGTEIFRIISNEIKNIAKKQTGIYKLNGHRIAILLSDRNKHKEIIEKIKDMVIKYESDYIKVNSYISYTEDRKERILFSSAKSLDQIFMEETNRNN
ncbi:hypothetical protein GCM10012288_00560 [Malaciobacter pacificus]|uniref:Uncharacterized protein n=1 Tax=Malaciobacter pacificus TaxID=1080223 RepID=A0A5C2H755_9BACT|nr:GGDEF domain-containing protein [Malaciobacter pacificus]QEP33315.1 hypothetical protein APAC_0145 [Malaciobacter pacificus]GGD30405.1 hypothetical protein GCM10012288_00560 [Malaciobacter pacificus]